MAYCAYCDGMVAAFPNANYCSHRTSTTGGIHSNAYLFQSKNTATSGRHLSRHSIRLLNKGYQEYKIDNRHYTLQTNNFLFVPEGSTFENKTNKHEPAEGLIIAFNNFFFRHYIYAAQSSVELLLARPFDPQTVPLDFYMNSYIKSEQLQIISQEIAKAIQMGIQSPFYFQFQFMKLLDELILIEQNVFEDSRQYQALKKTTREELYRRLRMAMEFIDSNLSKAITLNQIAKASYLSPFHFLRSFTKYYGLTPYQYLLSERLSKAHYLIQNEMADIEEIMQRTGFENKQTLQRAYMRAYKTTPFQAIQKQG